MHEYKRNNFKPDKVSLKYLFDNILNLTKVSMVGLTVY